MTGQAHSCWTRYLVQAALALALATLLPPMPAQAGCGDGLMPLAAGGRASTATDHASPSRTPCSGPHCRHRPATPLLPPVAVPGWWDEFCPLCISLPVPIPSPGALLGDVPVGPLS